ncbi:MAG TPA: polysaccharide deacetylase family protein [Pseudonocardiaceae bacterium]
MRCVHDPALPRRGFFGLLGVGLATLLAGCDGTGTRIAGSAEPVPPPGPDWAAPAWPAEPGSPLDSLLDNADTVPPSSPWTTSTARVVELRGGPVGGRHVALTIDDGYCNECVAGFVAFAQRTGIHLTFSPNGLYAHAWAPHAPVLTPLIEAGQVQIMNHTFNHFNLTRLAPARVRAELERNERWIAQTFATTTRPYYRPPFGFHNAVVDDIAADAGFDRVVMWNGSFGNATTVTPDYLMNQARRYLHPGVIMLGHANHDTVVGLLGEISQLVGERDLKPVTLDEMFGTRRPFIRSLQRR